jgi:hypothetical protein
MNLFHETEMETLRLIDGEFIDSTTPLGHISNADELNPEAIGWLPSFGPSLSA